ncbi:MAG TPA: signal peptidase II, partial [Clostridiales bacterium]|nr:signal peptidase II [Clostridiales bacterium]
SKKYVWNFVDQNGVQENVIGLFNLVKVKNEGAGFGIFQGKTIGLTIITFIVVIAICVYLFFALKETEWLRISLVFITAGGIGNIVDRIAFGYVRDFIQFSFWDSFPVFNIADSFVTVGAFMLVVVLIVMLVKEGKKNQKEFEEEQKNVASNEHEQIDPLDAPINLNPMMKSQNDYSFVVSEKKDEKVEQNDVKNTEENTQNSAENSQKSAENSNDIPQNDTQNQVESTAENTDGEKNADKE